MNREEAINTIIKDSGIDTNQISDGYHTFGELYEHRIVLFMALCKWLSSWEWVDGGEDFKVFKSRLHSDGSEMKGWFIMGTNRPYKETQITYHLPERFWDQCDFATTLDRAPEWDGHTSSDVLKRLLEL